MARLGGIALELEISPPPTRCRAEFSWGRWTHPPAHSVAADVRAASSSCWIRVSSNLVGRVPTGESGPPSCDYQFADLASAQQACARSPWCGGITYLNGGLFCDGCYADTHRPGTSFLHGRAHYELRYGCLMELSRNPNLYSYLIRFERPGRDCCKGNPTMGNCTLTPPWSEPQQLTTRSAAAGSSRLSAGRQHGERVPDCSAAPAGCVGCAEFSHAGLPVPAACDGCGMFAQCGSISSPSPSPPPLPKTRAMPSPSQQPPGLKRELCTKATCEVVEGAVEDASASAGHRVLIVINSVKANTLPRKMLAQQLDAQDLTCAPPLDVCPLQEPRVLIVIGGVRQQNSTTLASPAAESKDTRWQMVGTRTMTIEVSHNSMDWTSFIALAEHGNLIERMLGPYDAFFYIHDTVSVGPHFWRYLLRHDLSISRPTQTFPSNHMGLYTKRNFRTCRRKVLSMREDPQYDFDFNKWKLGAEAEDGLLRDCLHYSRSCHPRRRGSPFCGAHYMIDGEPRPAFAGSKVMRQHRRCPALNLTKFQSNFDWKGQPGTKEFLAGLNAAYRR